MIGFDHIVDLTFASSVGDHIERNVQHQQIDCAGQRPMAAEQHHKSRAGVVRELQLRHSEHGVNRGQVRLVRMMNDAVADAFGLLQAGQSTAFQHKPILAEDWQLDVRQPSAVALVRVGDGLQSFGHHSIRQIVVHFPRNAAAAQQNQHDWPDVSHTWKRRVLHVVCVVIVELLQFKTVVSVTSKSASHETKTRSERWSS
jgi:hypothetical protein